MKMITRNTVLPALLVLGLVQAATVRAVTDGTYKVHQVNSQEECRAYCEGDNLCRGWVYAQADVRFPQAECRLNDGGGAAPLFAPVPPTPLDLDRAEAELNQYRASHGLSPVKLNTQLIAASQKHSDDLSIRGEASHTGADGFGHDTRVKREGYIFSTAAENVATGQKSWDDAFQGWKDSPGHNANLLAKDVTEFGVALTYNPDTTYMTYWTMVLAAPLY